MIPVDSRLVRLSNNGKMIVRIYEYRGAYFVSEQHRLKEQEYECYGMAECPEPLKTFALGELFGRTKVLDEVYEEIKIRVRERIKNDRKRVRNRKKQLDQAV
jgi:hypothetical protein